MTEPSVGSDKAVLQRQEAEKRAARAPLDSINLSPDEIQHRLHELRVHQIELEMQNEELRAAQAALDALRERYFDLYDLAPVGYITLSEQGLILEANLTFAGLLGMARGELVRQPLSRFILKEDQDIYYLHRKQIFESGEPQACDLRMVKKDGTRFWAHLSVTAAQDGEGAPVCRVVISDITARKQAEEVLRASEEKFRLYFEKAPLGYQSLDSDGKFLEVNQTWLEMLGYTRNEVVGHWFGEFLAPDFVEGFRKSFPLFKAAGKIHIEFKMLHKNGSQHLIAFEGLIGNELNGNFKQTHCVLQDITERKQAEVRMAEQLEELRSWYNLTLGRETRILELKQEVNDLLAQLGQPQRYASSLKEDAHE